MATNRLLSMLWPTSDANSHSWRIGSRSSNAQCCYHHRQEIMSLFPANEPRTHRCTHRWYLQLMCQQFFCHISAIIWSSVTFVLHVPWYSLCDSCWPNDFILFFFVVLCCCSADIVLGYWQNNLCRVIFGKFLWLVQQSKLLGVYS